MVNGHGHGKVQVGQNGKRKELFFLLLSLSSPLWILIASFFSPSRPQLGSRGPSGGGIEHVDTKIERVNVKIE